MPSRKKPVIKISPDQNVVVVDGTEFRAEPAKGALSCEGCQIPLSSDACRAAPCVEDTRPDGREVIFRSTKDSADYKQTNPKDAIGVGKAGLSCVPMNVVVEVGVAMQEGALKYGRHNWRAVGVRSSVYFDAAMRHLISWWEGEDVDPDSGLSHITKAIAGLAVLRDSQIRGMENDDRPWPSEPFYLDLNNAASALREKHADKSPVHIVRGVKI